MEFIETVEEHCKHRDCAYRMKFMHHMDMCGYLTIEGHPRECSISECDKYRRGKLRMSIEGATPVYRIIDR